MDKKQIVTPLCILLYRSAPPSQAKVRQIFPSDSRWGHQQASTCKLKKAASAFLTPTAFKNESFNAKLFISTISPTKKDGCFLQQPPKKFF
ncbi:hypothetical protein [Phascolarctobacterium succinatutens]|uniref:hypothetical protein n=1 Tax=Phascolarctobacterium succinatutens TaxID=626940 RepID=UPI0026F1313C|nr:hypothetical protein [Phascolarctobacterium succinatutens]